MEHASRHFQYALIKYNQQTMQHLEQAIPCPCQLAPSLVSTEGGTRHPGVTWCCGTCQTNGPHSWEWDNWCCVPGTMCKSPCCLSGKQAGALTNNSMNTDVQSSQVTVLTQHWQSLPGLPPTSELLQRQGSGHPPQIHQQKLALESIHIRSQPNPLTIDNDLIPHVYDSLF